MDAVTYPDKAMQEISKKFVCVRVEVDAQKELAKKHGVEPITDIRLLDPDGKELDKLVGFTSASKLAARCQAVLDRLAGKSGADDKSGGAFKNKPVDAKPDAIDAAVKKSLGYLKSAFRSGWKAADGFSPDDLVLFAWASAGVDPKDEDFVKLRDRVPATKLTGTYQAALRALALARIEPKTYREALEACAKFLVGSQLENGQWTYNPSKEGRAPKLGDNSNTAYAILGLAACRKAGIVTPESTFRKAEAWWRGSQNADGGWGYRTDRETASYASMTESGLSSLLLVAKPDTRDAVVTRAVAWLKEHFSVAENQKSAYQEGRLVYHLYVLERVGTLMGTDQFVGHDWHKEGAGVLLANQKDDGSWDDGADTPVPNTALALLFLTRATRLLK